MKNEIKYMFALSWLSGLLGGCLELESKTAITINHKLAFDSVFDVRVATDGACSNYKTVIKNWRVKGTGRNTETVEGIEAQDICIDVRVMHLGSTYTLSKHGSFDDERKIDRIEITFDLDTAKLKYVGSIDVD